MLFNYMVTRKPFPIYPVTNHPFHIGPTLLTFFVPKHTLVPIYVTANYIADISFLNFLMSFNIATLVMTLSTGYNGKTLAFSNLGSCNDFTASNRINCNRFL